LSISFLKKISEGAFWRGEKLIDTETARAGMRGIGWEG